MKSNNKLLISFFGLLAILALIVGFIGVTSVQAAASIVVNTGADTNADDGLCSLREAITNANNDSQIYATAGECAAGSGADSITFAADYTITLGSLLPDVATEITITGNGAANTIIDGAGLYRVFFVNSTGNLTLDSLTVQYGRAVRGGGIYNSGGSLTITNSAINANTAADAASGGQGGGVYSDGGTTTISSSTISANMATNGIGGDGLGAGIYNANGTTTITHSAISNNNAGRYGGGVYMLDATLEMSNSTLSGNSAATNGGGVYATQSGGTSSVSIINSTIAGSTNGGGVVNGGGAMTLTNTIVSNNTGGNCGGTIANGGNNIDDGVTCGWGPTNGSMSSTAPKLGALTGSPAYYPLLLASPAINAGTNTGCPADDQRGVTRPQNGTCDIGSYEYDYAGIYYVKPTAVGAMNCQSWDDACELRDALITASSGDEIWAAAGTHTPSATGDRTASFTLKNGIGVYGGFAGIETLRTQRDPATNVTILSGDLNGDDNSVVQYDEPTRAENSYHVVVSSNTDSTAVLDGFTVTGGNANASYPDEAGSGMYNFEGSPTVTNVTFSSNSAFATGGGIFNFQGNPTLTDVTFSSNNATYGGGIYSYYANPTLTDVTFSGNGGGNAGGGMYNAGGSPTLTNATFSANVSIGGNGGGMYNIQSNPTLTNATFAANAANNDGGGMYNEQSSPTLTNVTFSGNSVYNNNGGGMYNFFNSNPMLTNVTFSANAAITNGGGMYNDQSSPILTAVTFYDNSANNGGGMYNYASAATLTNVTFNSNHVTNNGGGMYNNSSNPALVNATFSGNSANSGGGMYNDTASNPTLVNVIIANSSGTGDCILAGGATLNAASSNNLIEDSANACGLTNGDAKNSVVGFDPLLGAFGYYSGVTQSFPLLPGSRAINAGTNTGCPTNDQRGVARDSACDIGSFEYDYTGIYYVKQTAVGAMNCQSWDNACKLRDALITASSGDEIWVAAGMHTPSAAGNRAASFTLKNGVGVYGGFAGTETLLTQRDPATNVTILSGDLNGDDSGFTNNGENSYHVVVGSAADSTAVLDGFTVRGGNANSFSPNNSGGGMFSNGGSPTITDVTFNGNYASANGGGMYNTASSPTLTNTDFSSNFSDSGGGMHNFNSNPILTNVTFSGNSAAYGAGMYNNNSDPTLTDATFLYNSASSNGGGMHNFSSSPTLTDATFSNNTTAGGSGGGMYNFINSSPSLTNVTFSENSATGDGGGVYNIISSSPTLTNVTFGDNSATSNGGGMYNESDSNPIVTNVTFSSNYASTNGGGMYNTASSPTLKNVIIANSVNGGDCVNDTSSLNAASTNNLIEDSTNACGLTNGTNDNIIGQDPTLDILADNGGATQTMALLAGSPAINAGTNIGCPADDQRGVARPQNGICDIGAYEYESVNTAPVAVADSYATKMSAILNAGSVLANDTDADGDTLAAVTPVVSPPSHAASFTFNPDGTFSYAPVTGYQGTDTFSYKANDGALDSNIATVTITISPYTSTFVSVGIYDGWIMESGENSNRGSKIIVPHLLRLGDHDHNQQDRAFVFFNTGSLPDSAVITKATLRLRKINEQGENPFTWGGNLLADIKTGFFGVSRTLESNDFQAKPTRSNIGIGSFAFIGNEWYQVLLKASGRTAINRTGPTQFRLRFAVDDNNNQTIDFIRFYSGNQATVSRPRLVIEYYVP